MPEFLGEALSGTRRIRSGHPGQNDQTGRPLDQGANDRPITGSLDEVALPVTRHGASGHLSGALGNRRHSYWGSGRVDPSLAPEAGVPCAPDATRPAIRFAGCRGAAPTGPHRWSRSTAVCSYRQDTRGGAVRQSARASSLRPDASGRTATARGPGVCALAAADGLEPTPGRAPCRLDTDLAPRCGPTHGSRCWALASTPSPSSATTGRGPGPDSRFHVLRHSCVDRISYTWQHRSPSGPVVLHLELELKPGKSELVEKGSKQFRAK